MADILELDTNDVVEANENEQNIDIDHYYDVSGSDLEALFCERSFSEESTAITLSSAYETKLNSYDLALTGLAQLFYEREVHASAAISESENTKNI